MLAAEKPTKSSFAQGDQSNQSKISLREVTFGRQNVSIVSALEEPKLKRLSAGLIGPHEYVIKMKLSSKSSSGSKNLIKLFILLATQAHTTLALQANEQPTARANGPNGPAGELLDAKTAARPPSPIQSASYVSLDGLTLVVVFDKPVNLSASIESVEQRRASAGAHESAEQSQPHVRLVRPAGQPHQPPRPGPVSEPSVAPGRLQASGSAAALVAAPKSQARKRPLMCQTEEESARHRQPARDTPHLVEGVQLCALLLTKKTLKLLHKYRLYNCIWASRVQFVIQLARPLSPAPGAGQVRVGFRRGTIGEQAAGAWANERELGVELARLPLEGLGVPLAPRVALTGPNQVPPCGQFWLSAHLSSPFGTQPDESVRLSWSVERVGLVAAPALAPANASQRVASQLVAGTSDPASQMELIELRWQTLQQLVANQRANNLLLDAQLLQFVPQLYEFRLTVTFVTSLTSVTLNATHRVGRLDFEAPIGTIYGSHLLAQEQHLNTNQELVLLADIQVPECAQNVKQVGLYWQVSDPRVRFEQTYAPFYLARPNTLPEQALIEFRLNLFYGIRVKRFASAGTLISTGDSVLDAQISDGLLMASIGQQQDQTRNNLATTGADQSSGSAGQLELYATSGQDDQQDKYTYQWLCFDGKTAQPCYKSLKVQASSNGTRYDIGSLQPASVTMTTADGQHLLARANSGPLDPQAGVAQSGLLLVDKPRQRQPVLRLPLSWLDSDAQLWFGLQRFDRHNPSQQSKTEYALVSVLRQPANLMSIGPVLVGRARQRATIRNPLTGAMILIAHAPVIIIGRLGPSDSVGSFKWRMPNYLHPLHWTVRNSTNPMNGQQELVTELHLNPDLLIAHAHHQVQLVACSRRTGSSSMASLSLDIIQGVSQCRVELATGGQQQASPVSQQVVVGSLANVPLVITINYCNIPLGLSPITYQLYLIDTSASDGFIENNRLTQGSAGQSQPAEDDYTNEADELYLESLAQPISVPQLSPIFVLSGLNGVALMALLQQQHPANSTSGLRFRFGARVCDRLRSCRMFYSSSINPIDLIGASNSSSVSLAANQSSQALALAQLVPPTESRDKQSVTSIIGGSQQLRQRGKGQTIQVLRNMIEAAKRASIAGNSIVAISILNGVINLSQRVFASGRHSTDNINNENRETPKTRDQELEEDQLIFEEDQLRDILQHAMRDCLHYGSQSIQRQFQYTESGQTNLVLQTLANILSTPHSGIEFKFRAMRLMVQLTRRTIDQVLGSKLNCLADFKSIRSAYESLFGIFSQHSVESTKEKPNHSMKKRQHQHQIKSSWPVDNNNNTNQHQASTARSNSSLSSIGSLLASATTSTTAITKSNRRKREEAILAYLRSVRQAHKSLLQTAAIQLALGSVEQFEYLSSGAPVTSDPNGYDKVATSSAKLSAALPQHQQAVATQPADIVSSLIHQTDLPSDTIDVDLHEFGSISVKFSQEDSPDAQLSGGKLARQISGSQLRCKNDTQTKCSSFVLAVTSFAGKAPFRSLDSNQLRVPVLQMDWLSPIDGSNLIELLRQDELQADESSASRLKLQDFKATVTFTIPDQQVNGSAPGQHFKCYRFDEEANEWASMSQADEQVANDQSAGGDRRIRCSFSGFGVVGAFQGKPPEAESSDELTVVFAIVGVFGLVAIFSLLGCFASKSRSKQT